MKWRGKNNWKIHTCINYIFRFWLKRYWKLYHINYCIEYFYSSIILCYQFIKFEYFVKLTLEKLIFISQNCFFFVFYSSNFLVNIITLLKKEENSTQDEKQFIQSLLKYIKLRFLFLIYISLCLMSAKRKKILEFSQFVTSSHTKRYLNQYLILYIF